MTNLTYTDMVEHHPTLQLLTFISAGPVLELGVRAGDTTLVLLEAAGGQWVTGVDIDPCLEAHQRVREAGYADRWRFVQGDSLEAVVPRSGWGLVFIDTSHTYEQTAAELARFSGKFIALHDSEEAEDSWVRQAIDEHVAATGLREFRWRNSYGLSVLTR